MSEEMEIPGVLAALQALAPQGFAIALHIRFATPAYLFQTYPDAWLAEYSREGMVMRDPTVAWAFERTGTVSWADLSPRDEAGVLARAAEHGLRHGVTVGMERRASRSMASFARADRDFRPDETLRLVAGMEALHDATASVEPLPAAAREALRRLSVAFTHP